MGADTTTPALDAAARAAIESACAEVRDPVNDPAEPDGRTDRVDGVPVGVVARPTDTDQVAAVLRAASAHGLAVVPRGRGTKITWGMPPDRADVLLDLSAMAAVLDHAAGDLIVHTQAGARLADVQEALSGGGQRLAIDETVPGASIGGTLATNASGGLRVATGTARDLLIGITVVRADGVVAKAGGRVVKNVAGYDLGKLMIGSFGTLAVVTEALFRLHPVPSAHRWVTVACQDAADAQRLAQAVVHAQLVPAAIEVEWPADGGGSLSVLLEGRDEGVDIRAAGARALLGAASTESDHPPGGAAAYPWDVTATGDARATALKLTFALSGLQDVLSAGEQAGVPVALRGSAGAGVAYAAIAPGTPVTAVASAVDRLREACTRRGGSLVVLDAPQAVKQAVDVWGPVPGIDLMGRVKDQFDPDHRLAPGRFVGGI